MGQDESVAIVAAGVVSPCGIGRAALRAGMLSGRSFLTVESFGFLGDWPVGRVPNVPSAPHEDRTITFLRLAFEQISKPVSTLLEQCPPERRAVCAATSKGALLACLDDPAQSIFDLTTDAPAQFLARAIDARGPRISRVTACATAIQNVIAGARLIVDGDADLVIVGSSEATLHEIYLAGLKNMGALSPVGCRPYDKDRRGLAPGEGAGLLLLASDELLMRSGVCAEARIASWAEGSDAYHATGVEPTGASTERVLRQCLRRVQWDVSDVDLFFAHGTGTLQNDAAESAALRRLSEGVRVPLVYSLKGTTGHVMGACGAIELPAALEILATGIAPPVTAHDVLADDCHGINVGGGGNIRRLLKWNLGFGGHLGVVALSTPGAAEP